MGNWFESTLGFFAPKWAAERAAYRALSATVATTSNSGGYDGAKGDRTSTPWIPSQQPASIYAVSEFELRQMRDRARELDRNNPIAHTILNSDADQVIGPTGFGIQATTDDPEWNKAAEDYWKQWIQGAEISGLEFWETIRLLRRGHKRDGDAGLNLTDDNRIQLIESDQITDPLKENVDQNGNVTLWVNGVGINENNRSVAYCIAEFDKYGRHTDDLIVDAEDFILYAKRIRNQKRGTTSFATVFTLFDQLDKYVEAVLMAARIAACLSIFITKTNPANAFANTGTTTNGSGQKQRAVTISPGTIVPLAEGEKIETVNPTQPQQSFPDNLVMLLRLIGAPFSQPLELTLFDFSRTNFASARASLLLAYRSFRGEQQFLIDTVLARLYRVVISRAVKAGELPPKPQAWIKKQSWKHRFIASPFPMLDALKEIQSIILSIDAGLQTQQGALEAHGFDYQSWLTQRATQIADAKAKGIPLVHHSLTQPFDTTPTPATTNAKQVQPDDSELESEENEDDFAGEDDEQSQ